MGKILSIIFGLLGIVLRYGSVLKILEEDTLLPRGRFTIYICSYKSKGLDIAIKMQLVLSLLG